MQRTHRAHYHHSRTIEMTSGSLWKNILLFSIPLVLTQLLEVLFNLSDVAVAGTSCPGQYFQSSNTNPKVRAIII